MKRFFAQVVVLLVVTVFFAGVLYAVSDPVGKSCEICKNEVKDKRFAMVIEKKKKTYYFDDIGCALKWRGSKCMPTQVQCDAVSHVFDYYTKKPVHIRAAYYLKDPSIQTPQGHGVIAFASEEGAKRFMKEKGLNLKVMEFEEVVEFFK